MSRFKICIRILILTIMAPAWAQPAIYLAREGDTLSTIASHQMRKPKYIYGEKGRLTLLQNANPNISNIDRISIGMEIVIPDGVLPAPLIREVASEEPAPPPPPPPGPVVVPVPMPTPPEQKQWGLGASLGAAYLRIDAHDPLHFGSAQLLSDAGLNVQVRARQRWSPQTETFQQLGFASYKFINVTTGQSVANPGTVSEFTFGLRDQLSERWSYEASLGMHQSLYIKATGVNDYAFEKIPVPTAAIAVAREVYRQGNLSLGLQPKFELLMKGSSQTIKTETGHALGLELYTDYRKNENRLKTSIFFRQSEQNANIVREKEQSVGVMFSFDGWVY